MKGFLVVLFLALLALSAFNFWQIRELKQEIAVLEQKAQEQQRRADASDQLYKQALDALTRAGDALSHTDTREARDTFEAARHKLDDAAKAIQEHAGPAAAWVGEHVRDLVGGSGAPSPPTK
jgi:hypothetical protein